MVSLNTGNLNSVLLIVILLIVSVGVGATYYIIGTQFGNSENATQIHNALNTIYITNGFIVGGFAILNWFVIHSNESVRQTYMFFFTHIALLFSFTALGVSMISKGV